MAKRTSPVKEEECSITAAAGGIQDGEIGKDDDELKYARAEVEEAREENERLKKVVTRTVKDYEALQMHFFDVMDVQQEPAARSTPRERRRADDNFGEPAELVSLRLGTSAINAEVHEKKDNRKRSKEEDDIGGLTLGLDYSKFGSSSHSAMIKRPPPSLSSDEEPKEEEAVEPWPPSAKNSRSEDEEVKPLQAHIVKRARVSVKARCVTPTMNDGCQWRKYGQKVSKGNPCPRAYYRCTCAPMCPVRKQVQRCAEDTSILITTYEGSHNHPLPISATAMASTTSAAACMLTSGSSAPRLSGTFATSSSSSSSPQSAYPYNYSPISSHPTITLDLTDSKYNSSDFAPAAVPTTLNFSSSIDQSNSMPSWTSSCTSHPYSSLNQTCWQRAATSALPPPAPNNLSSTDTIARAITSDSSFQSALAAAITSYVENIANIASGNLVNVGAYGYSRYLNRSTSLLGSSRRGGSTLLRPPALVISSGPKSASGSPVDEMEHAC